MPVARLLGMRFLERTEAEAAIALPLRAEFLQVANVVHGGILATLADTAAVYLLLGGGRPERAMTSIEFKLNFLRPALLEQGELLARATLVKRGRTIALADVDVEQAGKLVAKGLFTYLFAEG
jgi:uncharacterized protein (TIGR00369 family)